MLKTINLDRQQNVKLILYPDNQPHVIVNTDEIKPNDLVRVVAPLRNSLEILQLLEVSSALDEIGAVKKELVIPYLMSARFDRIMQPGDSFDLKVISKLINSCHFISVNLFDIHSKVSTDLIENSRSHNNSKLLQAYDKKEVVLICPDKGALARLDLYKKFLDIKDVVYCEKSRDLSNGALTLTVKNPEKCEGQNCVIVDDLCDGGGTFILIANQIKPKDLTLIVSHGIFSRGFSQLETKFNQIIVSNSYAKNYDSKIVKLVDLGL
jgi:ribose-phosphate pyrophosphokinase